MLETEGQIAFMGEETKLMFQVQNSQNWVHGEIS